MPVLEIQAFLPIERSLDNLAYMSMASEVAPVIEGVKNAILKKSYVEAHDHAQAISFHKARKAIHDDAEVVYLRSGYPREDGGIELREDGGEELRE